MEAFSGGFFFLAVAVGVVVAIAGAVLSHRREQARIAQFTLDAATRGWDYVRQDDSYVNYGTSAPFGMGHSRTARHVFSGEYEGRGFVAFEYIYKVTTSNSKGGRRTTTYRHAVVSVGVPGALPVIRLSPEGVFSRLTTALGGTDVEVESAEFNRRWKVWTRDERAAHAMLTPRMIARFLEDDVKGSGFVFEPGILYSAPAVAIAVPIIESVLPVLDEIAGLLPAFLAQDYPAAN